MKPQQTQALWPQLADANNALLFENFFGFPCSTVQTLRQLFQDETEGCSGTLSYTVYDRSAAKLLGWVTLYTLDVTTGWLEVAFFLPLEVRTAKGSRAFYLICAQAFEQLGFKRITFRYGSLDRGGAGKHPHDTGAFGLSLVSILDRQLIVREIKEMEYGIVKDEQWPIIKLAFDAWEASLGSAGSL